MDPSSHTFDYKDLAVSVATNNKTGYQLTMSTASTSLINTADNTLTIPTLDALSGGYTTATFQTNKWGYSKDSGNYFPFPASELLLQNTTATNGDNTDLRFATKIDYTQPSGTYKTTISFNAVTNPLVDYIQDFTPDMCRTLASTDDYTVVDKRDDNDYTVRYINGNCWMTQNLRYIGDTGSASGSMIMKAATSNISTDTTIAYADLTVGNTDDHAEIATGVDNNGDSTVWYNYAAASAMTITGSSNSDPQQYDVCPTGWRLPSNTEQSSIISYVSQFNPVTGGYYLGGALGGTGSGNWWASTVGSASYRYRLYYDGSSLGASNYYRYYGYYVRCILNDSRTISDITTMQEISLQIVAKMTNGDTATLKDSRDGQEYTVAKINGNLWMTRNLAIGCDGSSSTYGSNISSRTLLPSGSNIASAWSTPTNSLTLGDDYTDSRMECSSTYGAWYNYAAASAGTITGSSNTSAQVYDICPAGWRLPTNSEQSSITSYSSEYSPITGGTYYAGALGATEDGYWLSSTSYSATERYILVWRNSRLYADGGIRVSGVYVRCVAK
ncbi:hypothetical protein IJG92_02430 [Candidatus Saccharibacteria bacterium]|nr:hypothetical protein [Candidatus Saccharibacteria bacterium]